MELHIFEGAQGVVDALRAHNCGELQCLLAFGHLPAVVQCVRCAQIEPPMMLQLRAAPSALAAPTPTCLDRCAPLAGPALAWCEEQRPRLRKAKSKLEFKLRVQVRPGTYWCGSGIWAAEASRHGALASTALLALSVPYQRWFAQYRHCRPLSC